jgi:hypothetical protein
MSDTKNDNKDLQLLVESIATKINAAPALNGGFDRMLVMVEHIQDRQEETAEKVDKIHDGLYEPDDGLYARVKAVETIQAEIAKRHTEHLAADEKHMQNIADDIKKLNETDGDMIKKFNTSIRLQKIAGDDLEKLESVIKVKSTWATIWSKASWILIGGILAAVGKTIWELISRL